MNVTSSHHVCLIVSVEPETSPEQRPLGIDPDSDPQRINMKKQICQKGRC